MLTAIRFILHESYPGKRFAVSAILKPEAEQLSKFVIAHVEYDIIKVH